MISMKDYLANHMKCTRTFKSNPERKKFLTEKGVKLVKDPTSQEYMVAVASGVQMFTGKRISAKKTKEEDYTGDREGAKEAFEKAKAGVNLSGQVNTKAWTH